MTDAKPPDRIYIASQPRLIDMFRAMRGWIEQHAAASGKTLDPAWYRDSPEERPELYPELFKKDQPDTPSPPQEGESA